MRWRSGLIGVSIFDAEMADFFSLKEPVVDGDLSLPSL
jgi:hypothetical protein